MEKISIIKKFIAYNDDFALSQILKALKITLLLNKNNKQIDTFINEICKINSITSNLPLLVRDIDKNLEKFSDSQNFETKTIAGNLKESPIASLYYSLSIALNIQHHNYSLDNNTNTQEKEFLKTIGKICFTVLKFNHMYYKYKNDEKTRQTTTQPANFYNNISITLTRVIEILVQFAWNCKNGTKHLENMYFKTDKDLDEKFFEIIYNNIAHEKDYFFLKHDDGKENRNYIEYFNNQEKIKVHIKSSRKLNRGSQSSQEDIKNTKIVDFILDGYKSFLKFYSMELKSIGHNKRTGYHTSQAKLQDTEIEPFLAQTWVENNSQNDSFSIEDSFDAWNKQKRKQRYKTSEPNTNIPSFSQQRQRNKAFSANITKRTLLLDTSYDIPPLSILKSFLQDFTSSQKNITFIYDSIFILDINLGLGYEKIVELLMNVNKSVTLKNDMIRISINQELFSTYKNKYIHNSDMKIQYYIPQRLQELVEVTKNLIVELNLTTLSQKIEADKYFEYIKVKKAAFKYTINFNAKHMWKIITNFARTHTTEDMTAMFCIGRYQQNDTPRLAYSSTPNKSQKHSKLVEKLYIALDMHTIIEKKLGFEITRYKESPTLTQDLDFAGSSQAANKTLAKEFFTTIQTRIKKYHYKKSHDYFNLVVIYTKYALSILIGTREYINSSNLTRISFETSTLIVTEKASTLLAGLRIIPLCDTARMIIQNYQDLCKEFKIDNDDIYLIINGEATLYKTSDAIEYCKTQNMEIIISEFIEYVPLNTGRHVITKEAFLANFNLTYLETLLGHYIAGGEQLGSYSNLNIMNYINKTKSFLESIADEYSIKQSI